MTRSAWASSARGTWARASRAASQRRASSGPPPSAPRPAAPSAAPPSPPSVPPSSPPTPSDVIVISVKPQIVKQVLVELKPLLSEEKLLVSIVVGIKMKDLQRGLVQRVEEDLQHICPGGGDTMVLGAHAGILLDLPWCTSNFQLTGEGTITLKFKLRVQKLDKLYADMAMQKALKSYLEELTCKDATERSDATSDSYVADLL